MKITDPDVIQNGEKDLIQALTDDLDMETIKEILQTRMNQESISSRGGEIVVHNSEIAFKLDFSIEISGSLMFDRQGNYIPVSDETDGTDNPISEDSEEQFDMDGSDDDLEGVLDPVETDKDMDTPASESDEDELPIDDLDPLTDHPDPETDLELGSKSETGDELEPEPDSESLLDTDSEFELDSEFNADLESEPDSAVEEKSDGEEDIVDEDIDDILKESRDFWEEKKNE